MPRVPSSATSADEQRIKLLADVRSLERRVKQLEDEARDVFLWYGFDATAAVSYLTHLDVVPAGGSGEGWVNWLAPFDCRVIEVVLVNLTTSYGDTEIAVLIDGSAADAVTRTLTAAPGEPVRFPLGTRVRASQRVTIRFDATADGGEIYGYCRIRRT